MKTNKEIYNEAFNDELEKIAKIRVGDIEDVVGGYLSDSLEDEARDLIAKETAKRFAVRHPVLASLPTLGLPIWPSISKGKAIDKITKSLARKHPEIRKMKAKSEKDAYRAMIEQQKLDIESDKANQLSNAATAAGIAALPLITTIMDNKRKEKEKEETPSVY